MLYSSLSEYHSRLIKFADRDLGSIRPVRLIINLITFTFMLSIGALAIGCSTRVEYLTDQTYSPREMSTPVKWLSVEPAYPHIELARITVGSTLASDETLRERIREQARALGADAVVEEGAAVEASMTSSPYYESSLLGPKGGGFGLYGYGWYTPYTSSPFLLTQGAIDQPRLDRYLSGMAIRYQEETTTNDLP